MNEREWTREKKNDSTNDGWRMEKKAQEILQWNAKNKNNLTLMSTQLEVTARERYSVTEQGKMSERKRERESTDAIRIFCFISNAITSSRQFFKHVLRMRFFSRFVFAYHSLLKRASFDPIFKHVSIILQRQIE